MVLALYNGDYKLSRNGFGSLRDFFMHKTKSQTIRKRSIVLIDGSNFYFKMKDLGLHHLTQFDFSSFLQCLVSNNSLVGATYYIGKIRTDGTTKVQKIFNHQRELLSYLKRHNISYSLGYLLKSNGKFHEKGVDVNMAVDILVATYEKLCEQIIIVSSDTDLLPAIKKAREKGEKVEYVGFSHKPSLALVANCTSSKLLSKTDLEKFVTLH